MQRKSKPSHHVPPIITIVHDQLKHMQTSSSVDVSSRLNGFIRVMKHNCVDTAVTELQITTEL